MKYKSYKMDTEIEERAKALHMNMQQYVKHLEKLVDNNTSEIANINNSKIKSLEGIVQSLVQQNISRRATELKLEKELRTLYENNNKVYELVLTKFEFINALEKEFK